MLGIAGVLSVLFGLLLVIFPGSGALSVVWLIGVYAITFGSAFIVLGLPGGVQQGEAEIRHAMQGA